MFSGSGLFLFLNRCATCRNKKIHRDSKIQKIKMEDAEKQRKAKLVKDYNNRRKELSQKCSKHYDNLDYSSEDAYNFFSDPEDARLALMYQGQLKKQREAYKKNKEAKSESYLKKVDSVKQKDLERSKVEKAARQKLKRGAELKDPEELKAADRIEKKKKYMKITPNEPNEEAILKKAQDLAGMNDQSVDYFLPIVTAAWKLPCYQRYEALRKYNPEDVKKKADRERKPRRKALHRQWRAMHPTGPRPGQTTNFTTEQRLESAERSRKWREDNKIKEEDDENTKDWTARVNWYPGNMKNRNMRLGFDHGLQVQCSLPEFLLEIFSLDCYYCGTTNGENGIDRIDPTKPYVLGNIVPCCESCNYAKKVQTHDQFIEHATKIHEFQSELIEESEEESEEPSEEKQCFCCGSVLDSVSFCRKCTFMKSDTDVDYFLDKMEKVAKQAHDLPEMLNIVNELHETLRQKHERTPAPITQKPSVNLSDFTPTRESSDNRVVIIGIAKTYHTPPENTSMLCLQKLGPKGNMVRKRFDGIWQEDIATNLIMEGKFPCKKCRVALTPEEHRFLFHPFRLEYTQKSVESMRKTIGSNI